MTLVLLTVASAVPLALLVQDAVSPTPGASSPAGDASTSSSSSPGPATLGLPFGPAGDPDAGSLAAGTGDAQGGTSSRPGLAGAPARGSGSALLDPVLGAAALMGHDLEVPTLPLDKLDPANPLRVAILEWVTVTNADVPADELSRELARADAIPMDLQRDLALLVVSATQATLLQREATAFLTPEQLNWIYAHPEVASDLARGVSTPDSRAMAALAAAVDTKKSLQAAMLLLTAVEATRGSLHDPAASQALDILESFPDVDPSTRAVLATLAGAGTQVTDQEKVRFAAQLVAATSGAPLPTVPASLTFQQALTRLIAATGQIPDAAQMDLVLARADALPDDLEKALATAITAEALAVEAASPTSTEDQAVALARVLLAVADALPVLEKYSLYWSQAPDALRVGQWSPPARLGWAAEHAALLASTRGDPSDVVRAVNLVHGIGLQEVTVPERSFTDAYVALLTSAGGTPTAEKISEVAQAGALLDPQVVKAAARMMSGAAESARLQDLAYARLTQDERAFLLQPRDLDALYLDAAPTAAQIEELKLVSRLAAQVDRAALARAELVAVQSMEEARGILQPLEAQGDARPVPTGWAAFLQNLLPWRTASAQSSACPDLNRLGLFFVNVENDCERDIYLIITDPFLGRLVCSTSTLVITAGGVAQDAHERDCISGTESSDELFVLSGPGSSTFLPRLGNKCLPPRASDMGNGIRIGSCRDQGPFFMLPPPVPRFGAARVWLDLGGRDTYQRPVAMTFPTQFLPVSLHLEMGGNDNYADASGQYDTSSSIWRVLPQKDGHPTQGSATGGGIAVLMDVHQEALDTGDRYEAPSQSQGYGQWGLGMLIDSGGRDHYFAGDFSQGASGRDFNLGAGILVDNRGDDEYAARSGQGFGVGGALLDLSGDDEYSNEHAAFGAPIVHLKDVPGGNLTTLGTRGDDRAWIDGPAELNLGVALDIEDTLILGGQPGDSDMYPDFVETAAGTDPQDGSDDPQTNPTAQVDRIAADADKDTWPDFIERALSSDPRNATSYPLGLPAGPTFVLPAPVGEISAGDASRAAPTSGMRGGDKILDLRVPVQDVGSIDFACFGPFAPASYPTNVLTGSSGDNTMNLTVLGVSTQSWGTDAKQQDGPCVIVGYKPTGPGEATVTEPIVKEHGTRDASGNPHARNGTIRFPTGILAVGDAVSSEYTADYFLVIDLGGDDRFTDRAGGGLPVVHRSGDKTPQTTTFFAPSLFVNIDTTGALASVQTLAPADVRSADGGAGDDTYLIPVNTTGDYIQGSMWSVLIDTQGDDRYVAGGGSQGALGGVLLDLAGTDAYTAGDLSQGASILNPPAAPARQPGMPANLPADASGANSDAPVRRSVPALHIDLGQGDDTRIAGNASQGYGRGFGDSTGASGAIAGGGILLDQGGNDKYLMASRSQHVQGVAGWQAIGILADLAGDDRYEAAGIMSQGATISPTLGTSTAQTAPGFAALLDLGGADSYVYSDSFGRHDRSPLRQDNLTVQRGRVGQSQSPTANAAYADVALHYDAEGVSLNAVAGTGTRNFTSLTSPGSSLGDLYVDMPNARLAIGGPGATTFAREYALVVDLGGENAYLNNAGGVLPDVLAQGTPTSGVAAGAQPKVPLFPVTFVLDAGSGASTYAAERGLVQGTGFFSVGILVDLGGADRFVSSATTLPSISSGWAKVPPAIDGSLDESSWNAIEALDLVLVARNESRAFERVKVRVANDAKNVYYAIEGTTPSGRVDRIKDWFVLSLQPGRDFAHNGSGTAIDETLVTVGVDDDCSVLGDSHFEGTRDLVLETSPDRIHGRAACVMRSDGTYTLEVSKPLTVSIPRDPFDLDLSYDAQKGFDREAAQMGFRLQHFAHGARDSFAWPAGSARIDGEPGYKLDTYLVEETRDWAVLALGSLGAAGTPRPVSANASLSQGAGLAGVGILAHLGTVSSSGSYVATDRAQGYGGFNGFGLLLDAGGSDTYVGDRFVQGASEVQSMGAFLDGEGNDVYRALTASQGFTRPGSTVSTAVPGVPTSSAVFVDLNGNDTYDVGAPARNRVGVDYPTPLGVLEAWVQGGGVGADYFSDDSLRAGVLQGLYGEALYGSSRTQVRLLKVTDNGQCSSRAIDARFEGRPVVSGLVCLQATVSLDNAPRAGLENVDLTLDGVDLLVDGQLLRSLPASAGATQDAGVWRFRLIVDSTTIEDGARLITAQAIVRATVQAESQGVSTGPRGVVVFYDQSSRGNTDSSVKALVNNPAFTQVALHPLLDARVDDTAIVAPSSADVTRRELLVDWNGTRDAAEDRYALANGWTAPVDLMNVACEEGGSRLCTLYPFYLRDTTGGVSFGGASGSYLTTEPVYNPAGRTNQRAGDGNAYSALLPASKVPVTLQKEDAFHLRLNTHKALFEADYITTLHFFLRPEGGGPKVLLAEDVESSHQTLGIVDALANEGVRQELYETRDQVGDFLDSLGQGSVFSDTVAKVEAQCFSGGDVRRNAPVICDSLTGNPGSGTQYPCRPSTNGNEGSARRTAENAVYEAIKGTTPCKSLITPLYGPAGTLDGAVSGGGDGGPSPGRTISDAGFNALASVFTTPNKNPLHWNDFYVDAAAPPGSSIVKDNGDGTITIAPGYEIVFEMLIDVENTVLPTEAIDVSDTWRDTVMAVVNPVYADLRPTLITAEQNVSIAVNSATEAYQCARNTTDCGKEDVKLNGTIDGQKRSSIDPTESNFDSNADKTLHSPVTAFFLWGDTQNETGGSQLPARIEMRVVSLANTTATAIVEDIATGQPIATLFQDRPVVGDVEGTPLRKIVAYHEDGVERRHPIYLTQRDLYAVGPSVGLAPYAAAQEPGPTGAPLDGGLRFTQQRTRFDGALVEDRLADGKWRLNLTTKDETNGVPSTQFTTFILDTTAPASAVESRGFAGTATLDGGALPISWAVDETGSGVARTWVFYKVGSGDQRCGGSAQVAQWCPARLAAGGDSTPWDPAKEWFGPNERVFPFTSFGSSDEYSFVTITQDRAGNVEFGQGAEGSLADILAAARDGKAGSGGATRIRLDQIAPGAKPLGAVDSAGLPQVRGFQGQDFTFVRAGDPITFKACARDSTGSGVGAVTFHLDQLRTGQSPLHREFAGAPVNDLKRECGDGWTLYTYGGWGARNANKTEFPDGTWTMAAEVTDEAGNHVKVGMGALILDSVKPTLRAEAPLYPAGQSAIKPGDRLTLRLFAGDEFGMSDASIRFDASALTRTGVLPSCESVRRTTSDPVNCYGVARISGVIYQEARILVDKPGVQNGLVQVPVSMKDNAGNENATAFVVAVDFKTFAIPPASVQATNASHNSVVLRWTTTEPTTSSARYGTSPLEMKLRAATNTTLVKDHELRLEGLESSTRYFVRVVSSTAGGYVVESDPVEAVTGTALYLRPIGPSEGAVVNGQVPITFEGGLLDSSDLVTFTLEAQADAEAPWTFVTTTTEPGGEHTLVFNSSRYLDGSTYRLRLNAESGKDKLQSTLGPILSDNTQPRLAILSPLVATNDTTPIIVAEATDNLAMFDADAAKLLVDGKAVEGFEPIVAGPTVRISHEVTDALAPGQHTLELRVKDKAGNLVVNSWKIAIDGDAPIVNANPTRYAPGREAAKVGGTVTLNVTVKDASGVGSVVAGLDGIGTPATVRFARVTGTDSYVGTFTVTSREPDTVKRLTILATDVAGNARSVDVDVPIDNVAPKVTEVRAGDIGQTRATLVANADEPVLLQGTANAPGAPTLRASGDRLAAHATLALTGLLPSRTYTYTLQAVDRAGNAVDVGGRFQTALDLQPPGGIGAITVLDLLDGTLRLSWSPATDDVGIAAYRVYRSADGASFRPLADVDGTTFDDTDLPLETAYVYQVVAVDHGGNEGPGSDRLRAFATAVPRLTVGSVTPTVGGSATVFQYVVTYTSPGGVMPAYVRVLVDGVPQDMTLQPGGSPEEGLAYVYETRLAPHKRDSPHNYSFEASDGRYTVRFPELGEPHRGPLVSGDADVVSPLGGAVGFAQRVPLIGAAGVTLALAAAAAIVIVLRRRSLP